MEQLPIYINIVFIITTFFAVVLLYMAGNHSKTMILIIVSWLALQAITGLSGFYTFTRGTPPRFALLLLPPVIFVIMLFFTKKGRGAMDNFDVKKLTLYHIVRIPVELTLYWLYQHKAVPGLITFEGRNFDILCGLTAPIIYYLGYVKHVLGRYVLIAWNIACLLLLANVVITAVLSAPLPFQQFALDRPNIALFYFPFVWLPGFIVPAALFAHLVTLRRLVRVS